MGPGGRRRWRLAAAGLALSLLVAGCSSGGDAADDVSEEDVEVGDGLDGTTTTNGGGGSTKGATGTTARAGATTTTAKRGGTTTTASGGGSATTRPTTVADSGARGGPGDYARTLLQPRRSERIVVELLVQPGAGPTQATLDHLARVLREASGKPVSVAGPVAVPTGDGTTSDAEIRELSDRHTRTPQTAEQSVIRLLYLNGRHAQGDSVLGVAVRGDTAAVFAQRVRQVSSPLVPVDDLEAAVTTHEVGHLLGLVDLVLSTGREDPEHPGHSSSSQSVMFWAIESSLVGRVLNGPPPRDFDAQDRDDLAAIRNGG